MKTRNLALGLFITGALVLVGGVFSFIKFQQDLSVLPYTGEEPTDNQPALVLEKIVALDLDININTPTVSISNHEVKDGYVTKQDPFINQTNFDYSINTYDSNGKLVWQGYYVLPIISNPPPIEGSDDGGNAPVENVKISVNIPYLQGSRNLQILDNLGNLLYEIELPEVTVTSLPTYNITGISAAPDELTLNVVIMSSGFTDAQIPQFQTLAANMASSILAQGPFKQRASQIKFTTFSNTANISCVPNASTRLILCDWTAAKNLVTAAGLVDDKIIIIHNTSTYSGAGMVNGEFATVYNGPLTSTVIIHEFSHTLNLYDEYNYGTTGQTVALTYRNCYRAAPPYAGWDDIVPANSYFAQCGYSNWYRTSADSRMRSNTNPYYNSISLNIINNSITNFAGVYTSPDPLPSASITTPANNSNVTGSIAINSNFTNAGNLQRAELRVNDVLQAVSYTAPFNFTYNLGSAPGNNVSIKVRPVDYLERAGQEATVILNPTAVTSTPSPTATNTPVPTATNTPLPTATKTPTPSPTFTPTKTPTPTFTPTKTPTPNPTFTKTLTPTITKSPTPKPTNTSTPKPTVTLSPTMTPTRKPTFTPTKAPTLTPTRTPVPSILPAIVCGPLDVNGDKKLNYIDLAQFMKVYGRTCRDFPITTGCQGKDVRIKGKYDSKINFIDLDYFTKRYNSSVRTSISCMP